MKEAKERITVTVDADLLRRLDAVAAARGDSRSAVLERLLGNAIGEDEVFLKAMENPITRAVAQAVTSSPALIESIARLVGEQMSTGDAEEIREVMAEQAKRGAGRRGSRSKKSGRLAGEGA